MANGALLHLAHTFVHTETLLSRISLPASFLAGNPCPLAQVEFKTSTSNDANPPRAEDGTSHQYRRKEIRII